MRSTLRMVLGMVLLLAEEAALRVRLAIGRLGSTPQPEPAPAPKAVPPSLGRGDIVWLDGRNLEVWGVDGDKAYVRDARPYGSTACVSVRHLMVQRGLFKASAPWEVV